MKEHSPFRDLTRGGQITLHSLHMLFQVLRYGILITLLIFAVSFYWFYSKKTTAYDRSMLMHSMGAELKIMIDAQSMVQIPNPNGSVVALPAKAFLHSPKLQLHLQRCQQGFWVALEQSLMVSLCALALLLGYFKIKGKLQAKARRLATPVFLERDTFAMLSSD